MSVVDIARAKAGAIGEYESDNEQLDELNALVDELDIDSDSVRVKLLSGRPITALIDELIDNSHGLLVKDADCPAESLFLGELDMRLLQISPAPVWFADPDGGCRATRILVAIDPLPLGDEADLNRELLRTASSIAQLDSAELFVVSALHPGESRGGDPKELAWEYLHKTLADCGCSVSPSNVEIELGFPVDVVLNALREIQPDLLVMGSLMKPDIPGLWVGNTASLVVRQIQCSLLTMKPSGFEATLPAGRTSNRQR